MRFVVAGLVAVVLALGGVHAHTQTQTPTGTAPEYDFLIKGGHVIDPKNSLNAVRDVAIKDGRIAVKDFVLSAELLKGTGPLRGFSTYTFEDGSSITATFTGEIREGRPQGTYNIVSGTGAYANATGTGTGTGTGSAWARTVMAARIPSSARIGEYWKAQMARRPN